MRRSQLQRQLSRTEPSHRVSRDGWGTFAPGRHAAALRITVEAWGPSAEPPDIVAVLQDLFWLSQLNWSAPEVDTRLPLTLRFTAQKLGRFVLAYDDEDDFGEWGEETLGQGGGKELPPGVDVA